MHFPEFLEIPLFILQTVFYVWVIINWKKFINDDSEKTQRGRKVAMIILTILLIVIPLWLFLTRYVWEIEDRLDIVQDVSKWLMLLLAPFAVVEMIRKRIREKRFKKNKITTDGAS